MAHGTVERSKQDKRTPGVTYQLEKILCGKPRCANWHGPYWYAYWKHEGKTRSRYMGKKFKLLSPSPAA